MIKHFTIPVGLLITASLGADTLGFVEQKFSDLHFEAGKWIRTVQAPCFTYAAQADGAMIDVLRVGMNTFIPFKARKGLTVIVCGSTAAFEEGFEAGLPVAGKAIDKRQS